MPVPFNSKNIYTGSAEKNACFHLCVSVANKIRKFLFIKIFLTLLVVLGLTACKKVHQQLPQPDTGRMLQVELRMPEPWEKIGIGSRILPENYKISREDQIRRRRFCRRRN